MLEDSNADNERKWSVYGTKTWCVCVMPDNVLEILIMQESYGQNEIHKTGDTV